MYHSLKSSGFFDDADVSASIKFYEGNEDLIDAGVSVQHRENIGSYCVLISLLGISVGCDHT
jgi:hypothetical protein